MTAAPRKRANNVSAAKDSGAISPNNISNSALSPKSTGSGSDLSVIYDPMPPSEMTLKKQINLFHCVSIIIGIIVGAGIFVSPVGITQHVRSVGMSITLWAVSGLFSMLCALCYAELGSCLPESGGEYIYIRRAWGDFAAFMCLWMNYIIINPVCVAAASLVFSSYILRPIFPNCDPPVVAEKLLAVIIITLIVAVNCQSVGWVTRLQAIITCCKVVALLVIVFIGFVWVGKGHTSNFQNAFADSDYSAGAISIAFYSGFWAFGGWSYLNFLADEVINPHRNLPLGIMISITVVTIIYITTNVAYFAVLTPKEMLVSSAVAVTFLERTVPLLSYIIPVLIAISTVGGMNGSVLSMSRLFYVAAKNNHLPAIISMIHVENLTPAPSLISMLILVIIMQLLGSIFFLVEMMGFSLSVVLVMVFSGQVLLRWTEPDLPRPIKVPVILPIFLTITCAAILIITVYQKPYESAIALIIIAIGIPAYILCARWTKPKSVQNWIDQTTIFLQRLLLVATGKGSDQDELDTESENEDRSNTRQCEQNGTLII